MPPPASSSFSPRPFAFALQAHIFDVGYRTEQSRMLVSFFFHSHGKCPVLSLLLRACIVSIFQKVHGMDNTAHTAADCAQIRSEEIP